MRNLNDPENNYDYSPNELAKLSMTNREKYNEIIESNLDEGDTVEKWQQRNLEFMQKFLNQSKMNTELPKIEIANNVLVISISASDLKDIAEKNSNNGYLISDESKFLFDFAEQLKNGHSSNAVETGLSDLQYLFDVIIEETIIVSDAATDEGFENNKYYQSRQ